MFQTDQEEFWAGEFGNEYIGRNKGSGWEAANTALFSRILRNRAAIQSAIEFGPNIGLNIVALRTLLPDCPITAVEINKEACVELKKIQGVEVINQSLLEFHPRQSFDFVLIKGVLIHQSPDHLPSIYEMLYRSSGRYLCVAEYYNPSPVELSYRGYEGKLFKRDFAGEILDRFQDLKLIDYGFVYHRDPLFPQDDITWFLLEKR